MSDESTDRPAFQARGGVLIGLMHASWPMARLEARPDRLLLHVSFFGLGTLARYEWTPAEVVSVEPESGFLGLSKGLRIRHIRPDYPEKILFVGLGDSVVAGVAGSGFVPSAQADGAAVARGFPMRWVAVLAVVVIWNLLGWKLLHPERFGPPGAEALVFLGLFEALALGLLASRTLQTVFLKPGRHFSEVRHYVALVAGILALLFVVFSALTWTGALKRFEPTRGRPPDRRPISVARPGTRARDPAPIRRIAGPKDAARRARASLAPRPAAGSRA